MAVSITERPVGYFIGNPADISSAAASGSTTVFIIFTHGFSTGQVIYVRSTVGEYNGFKRITVTGINDLEIRNLDGSDVPFIKTATGTVNITGGSTDFHEWWCVHLPIVYKLSNTLWPANSADTVRNISSATDSNGYCNLSLSGDIKDSGSAAALEYVKITGDNDFNGVYQIISYSSETSFVIDLPYATLTAIDITNSQIQYYYNNYHIKVEVWGGLNNGHEYYAQEPYELLATLDLVPDENNEVKFSIHEILKNNIEVKNNLLLGTLPNNLDAFTMFFIKYAEVYDDSDGTTLTTTTPSYTSDLSSFEGKAVNAMLPFKNVYSGALSEYASADSNQKFLTAFTRPTIFQGKYFDLSFLWDGVTTVLLKKEWYLNEVLTETTYSAVEEAYYTGVYRFELEADCDYDRVDVTALKVSELTLPAPSTWINTGPNTYDSRTATQFTETVNSTTGVGNTEAYTPVSALAGDLVIIEYTVTIIGAWSTTATGIQVAATLRTSGGASAGDISITPTSQTIFTANETRTIRCIILATDTAARLAMLINEDGVSGSAIVTITMQSFYQFADNANPISETKIIDINCDCIKSKATGYYLSWLNPYGGFDSWLFTGYADELIDIVDTGETEENFFPEWPKSYGEFADTQRKQTFRTSRRQRLIRSQHVTEAQLSAIENIKTSPLVQIVNSIYDRRTVLVDADSFVSLKEENNLHDISFTITYTDDVPSQKV